MKSRGGFTLLELLVSMAILSIIVLLTAQIFEQSTVAWNGGARRVEVNMTGRAIADYVAQDLSAAIEDELYLDKLLIRSGPLAGSPAQFVSLDSSDATNRMARVVLYEFDGGTINRRSMPIAGSAAYDSGWDPSGPAWRQFPMSPPPDADRLSPVVVRVELDRYPADASGASMPAYVDVKVTVVSSYDYGKANQAAFESTFTSRAYMANRNRYRY